jgi:hypothetical protein
MVTLGFASSCGLAEAPAGKTRLGDSDLDPETGD